MGTKKTHVDVIDLSAETTKIKRIARDGNCCFRALSVILGGNPDHNSLRCMLNAWIREHKDKLVVSESEGKTCEGSMSVGEVLLHDLEDYEPWKSYQRKLGYDASIDDAINFSDEKGTYGTGAHIIACAGATGKVIRQTVRACEDLGGGNLVVVQPVVPIPGTESVLSKATIRYEHAAMRFMRDPDHYDLITECEIVRKEVDSPPGKARWRHA